MDKSGTSPVSTTSKNIAMDLILPTADKAVKAILPFLEGLSKDKWWTVLLETWVNFEVKGAPKSVSSFFHMFISDDLYILANAYKKSPW